MDQHTATAAVSATPKIVSAVAVNAYRDIRASGAPPAVRRCWRAIVENLTDDAPATLTYRAISLRARCQRRTAMRAVAFGVKLGCLSRETVKLDRYRGDYWNASNRYSWIGPPAAPVKRGEFRVFLAASLARAQGDTCHPEAAPKCHPVRTYDGRGAQKREERRTARDGKAPTKNRHDERVVDVDWSAERRRGERKNGRRATDQEWRRVREAMRAHG